MSTFAGRYGTSTPRTAEHPRAFTTFEFITGVFWALLWFQPMGAAITLVMSSISVPHDMVGAYLVGGAFVGFPVSIAAALVGAPLACVIGRALSRDPRDRLHLMAFSAYGIAVGLFVADVAGLLLGGTPYAALLLLPYACAAGVAVPLGWWKTSRAALAADPSTSGQAS